MYSILYKAILIERQVFAIISEHYNKVYFLKIMPVRCHPSVLMHWCTWFITFSFTHSNMASDMALISSESLRLRLVRSAGWVWNALLFKEAHKRNHEQTVWVNEQAKKCRNNRKSFDVQTHTLKCSSTGEQHVVLLHLVGTKQWQGQCHDSVTY